MITADEILKKAKSVYSVCEQEPCTSCCLELDLRDCARSAYYYIFHIGKMRADKIDGEYDENVGNHQRVINKLLNSSDQNDQALGDLLLKIRPTRVKADYRLNINFTKNEAYKLLRHAEKLAIRS